MTAAAKAGAFLAADLLAAPSARALVGDWQSYTNVSNVRDLEAFQGELYAATSGGIRRVPLNGGQETIYDNTDGVIDVSVQSLAAAPDGNLWAASESGVLYRLAKDKSRWEPQGLSYRSAGWRMKPRAMLYRAPYLILGSSKGLSFYHTGKGVAEVNITRMGTKVGLSVNGLAMVGDTLFAGTSKGIFRVTLASGSLVDNAAMDIYNPAIWTLVPRTADAKYFRPADPDTALPDTLLPELADQDSAHGFVYYGKDGVASEFEGDWDGPEAWVNLYGKIRIFGVERDNPGLIETVKRVSERVFMGDSNGLYEYRPASGRLDTLVSPGQLPRFIYTMITSSPGGMIAYGSPYLFHPQGGGWRIKNGIYAYSAFVDANRSGSHPIHATGPDHIYVGTWGFGFFALENGKITVYGQESCLSPANPKDPHWIVVHSLAPFRKQGLWLSTLHQTTNYKLAYYDFKTRGIQCFEMDTRNEYATTLEVVHDSLLVAVHKGGVDTWRIRERDGRLSLDAANRTSHLRSTEPIRAGLADRLGNYWVTSEGGRMFYIPRFGPDSLGSASFHEMEDFPGRECNSLALDARGHVWAGCVIGGLVEITPSRDSTHHEARRYGLNEGMLSEYVYHIAADTTNGMIWAVTDRGLTSYESPSRPVAAKLKEARAFPNPFLSRHTHVLFDGLSDGSRLQILTQGGSVVYSRSLTPDDGHQIRWDGRNQSGSRVREGVYFYVIRAGGETSRGKLIIAR